MNNCGDLWWLCGPVFNLTSPMYWIMTAVQAFVWYCVGRSAGRKESRQSTPTQGKVT